MEYIIILIVIIVAVWFYVDKKDHDKALKNAGGIRIKYKDLIDFLISQSQSEVNTVDKGVELYLSFTNENQVTNFYITEGFNVLLVDLSIRHPKREIKNKWEFDTRKYNQRMMIDTINIFLKSINNQSENSYFKIGDHKQLNEENPCYLINSGIFPKEILKDDSLDLLLEGLENNKLSGGFKEAITEVLIPYKISTFKLMLNKEYYDDPFPIDRVNNHRQIAPSLVSIKNKTIPRNYPNWFIIAFPDVLYWILNAQGEELSNIKKEFDSIEKNPQTLMRDGETTVDFFIHLIEFYIFNTHKSLECRNYNLK